MVRKGTLVVLAGFALVAGGLTSGLLHSSKRYFQRSQPIIEAYHTASDAYLDAREKLSAIPVSDRLGYTPQEKLPDYSESQAHSKIESAHQELDATKGKLREFVKLPEVKEYNLTTGIEFVSYGGAFAGLILVGVGGRRRLLDSTN